MNPSDDPSSSSRPQDHITQHIHLDWDVNFTKQSIMANVILTMKSFNSRTLLLDCHNIDIFSINEINESSVLLRPLTWNIISSPSLLGSHLEINDLEENSIFMIKISYKTTTKSSALQWIDGSNFLFSQCQAIHCRTMIPCQDTPQVKATYTATITTNIPLTTVMSANKRVQVSHFQTTFEQSQPIPSYLIAIAIGCLESRDISDRCRVWASPHQINEAEWEFEDTEDFLKIAEGIAGPYRWERYDLLILPPSFPYGGMENPCLTFITPSLLAGDKSLVDVVAHEIAHSWTGNLVGCKNWQHFWLNEGWTMFLERRIISHHIGEDHRQFDSYLGAQDLKEAIRTFEENPNATKLCPSLDGQDPDDLFSCVPYEKGYTLLYVLEGIVGGAHNFDPFIKEYVRKFGGSSLDSCEFKNFTIEYFFNYEEIAKFDWDLWFNGSGMPPIEPIYEQKLVLQSKAVASALMTSGESKHDIILEDWNQLSSSQRVVCLDIILNSSDINECDANNIDIPFLSSLVKGCNVEVMLKYYLICIRFLYKEEWIEAANFSARHGRMKYCRPILRKLYLSKDPEGKEIAINSFKKNEFFYHPIARQMIEKDLNISNK